jgi:hypothetical protein
LCQLCDNDVRSSINNLQFAVSSRRPVTRELLLRLNLAASQSTHNFFRDLSALLLFKSPKMGESRFAPLYEMTSAANHDDVLTDGLFTNYLNVPFTDSPMERAARTADWFCFYDSLQMEIGRRQHFELLPIVPVIGVAASIELGLASNPSLRQLRELKFPSKDNAWRTERETHLSLLREHLASMKGSALFECGLNITVFALERLPSLLSILDPLSPLSFAALSRSNHSQQAAVLARVTDGLRHYGFDYGINETVPYFKKGPLPAADASYFICSLVRLIFLLNICYLLRYIYRYRLEPALDAVVRFPSQRQLVTASEPPARECDNVLHKLFLKLRPVVVAETSTVSVFFCLDFVFIIFSLGGTASQTTSKAATASAFSSTSCSGFRADSNSRFFRPCRRRERSSQE